MLSTLIDLAKEATPEKRRQIMGHVTELFAAGADRYKTEELALFNTVLQGLVASVTVADRERLAARLAPIATVSGELALTLAADQISVARPMLELSAALGADDLLRLAKVKGQDHLLAISKRSHLESRLTDVLLERGDNPVQRSVAANRGAELSNWGLKLLVKLSEQDDTLRETMLDRGDVGEAEFAKLTEQLPEETRKRLTHLYNTNQQLVEDLFREASQIVVQNKLARRNARIDAKALLKEIRDGKRSLNKVFSGIALSNNLTDLAFILADQAGLELKYVTNAIFRHEIDGIAIICRALGIGETEFSGLCKARCTHLKLRASVADNWLSQYSVLDERDARRVLTFLKLKLRTLDSEAA